MTPLAIYLHIPFCVVRCGYCDFNTYAGLEGLFEAYTAALVTEIRRAGALRNRPAACTIFIGGGTPTVLPPQFLAEALAACREAFDVAPDAEITSEANPGTVDQAHFVALRAMGVNRLSMGVQSFDDAELRWLGRIHTAVEAETAFAAARAAGFDNINLDFIFGLPGQPPETWAATLARAVNLGPEHLSLYSLTVEHGTPLADQVRRGLASAPDDDLAADLYALTDETLAAGGYEQYEISNWARAGRQKAEDRRMKDEDGRMKAEDGRRKEPVQDLDPAFNVQRSPFILHPSPFILHPSSFILHPSPAATTSSTGAASRIWASARGRTVLQRSSGGGTCGPCRTTSAGSTRASLRKLAARSLIGAWRWGRR